MGSSLISLSATLRRIRRDGFLSIMKRKFFPIYQKIRMVFRKLSEWQFDHRWGVSTRGIKSFQEQSFNPLHITAERYEATTPRQFKRIMHAAKNMPMPEVFFDIGCGKGRTLFMASLHGFRRIIGVEFDSELAETAQSNIKSFQNKQSKSNKIEVVCQDAGTYSFPDENAWIYFFNPFVETVMAKTLENIRRSARINKERYIIYHFPKHESLMSDPKKFALIAKTKTCSIYRMIL